MSLQKQRSIYLLRNMVREVFLSGRAQKRRICDDRNGLPDAEKVLVQWPVGVPKPNVGLVRDRDKFPYWTKYERFLINNQIPYGFFDVHQSDWQEKARDFDLIVWRPVSEPAELEEAKTKIYILENYLGKLCYPEYCGVVFYENKSLQYELMRALDIPVVDTFLSYDFPEVASRIPQLIYPLILKVRTGSSSRAVELVKSPKRALRIAKRIFSRVGRKTYCSYEVQKDYAYFQKYQRNEGYDLRVSVCGPYVSGYYRDVPKGDFRASGVGAMRKEALPRDAIQLATEVCKKLGQTRLAVDMLRDPVDKKLYIVELSIFTLVKTPEQLHVNGIPGVYIMDEKGNYQFQSGLFWLQDFVMKEFLIKRWIPRYAM